MTYYGDCRDAHYVQNPKTGKCEHLVHDTHNCVFGHVKCIGKARCIKQSHDEMAGQYGGCKA